MIEYIEERIEYYSTMERCFTQDFIQDLIYIKKILNENKKSNTCWVEKTEEKGWEIQRAVERTRTNKKSSWK